MIDPRVPYRLMTLKSLLMISILVSILLSAPARASTEAGEMELIKLNGDRPKVRILFMEYFSTSPTPNFVPGTEFDLGRKGGKLQPGFTVFILDGRLVSQEVGRRALQPGAHFFAYNKEPLEFVSIITHAPVTMGHITEIKNGTIVVRRHMTRRYDTDGIVYQLFKAEIDKDAIFYLDGKRASAKAAIQDKHLVRVMPAQKQRIHAFSPSSNITDSKASFGEKHAYTRGGIATEGLKYKGSGKNKGNPIMPLMITEGGGALPKDYELNTKAYTLVDGRMTNRGQVVVQPGYKVVGFTFKGGKNVKYVLSRSNMIQINEGTIQEVDGDQIKVKMLDGKMRQVNIKDECEFWRDGVRTKRSNVLKRGMSVMIYDERPQVVDAWNIKPFRPEYTSWGRRLQHYRIDEYQLDGSLKILREGIGARDRSEYEKKQKEKKK